MILEYKKYRSFSFTVRVMKMETKQVLPAAPRTDARRLPPEPFRVDIRGMHKKIVRLDPRRVKPMKDNPRHEDNPGFTNESIESLGENLLTVEQQEPVKVIPLVDDPDFDAQLFDGARRHRGCLHSGISIEAEVREDVDPDDDDAIFELSVACNSEKAPHTPVELVHIVRRLRGMGKTNRQIGVLIGKSDIRVSQYFQISFMNAAVISMLSGDLSLQNALMLKDFNHQQQLVHAQHIVKEKLTDSRAKRYIHNCRRESNVADPSRGRPKRAFDKLRSLTDRSNDSFGMFLDMNPSEIHSMIRGTSPTQRANLTRDLAFLSSCLNDIAKMIEPTRSKTHKS
jgi:ParB/RepB/Spo0J family partition protein